MRPTRRSTWCTRARCSAIAATSSTCASPSHFAFGGTRLGVNFELYNAFNTNAVLTENATYSNASVSGWRIPTSIVPPRFMKFSVQMDF